MAISRNLLPLYAVLFLATLLTIYSVVHSEQRSSVCLLTKWRPGLCIFEASVRRICCLSFELVALY